MLLSFILIGIINANHIPQQDHEHSAHSHLAARRGDDRRRPRVSSADMDKVYTTIKQVVRDWSAEVRNRVFFI